MEYTILSYHIVNSDVTDESNSSGTTLAEINREVLAKTKMGWRINTFNSHAETRRVGEIEIARTRIVVLMERKARRRARR